MKIPRYSGTDVNISSGRSLTTGIGSSQGLVEVGKTALNAVTQYANAKTNYDAKMRRLEINTNVDLSDNCPSQYINTSPLIAKRILRETLTIQRSS